jgi:ABC-type phosphate/phosphonate transport system substrate-binding protein
MLVKFFLSFFLCITVLFADEKKVINIGVLSFREANMTKPKYMPLADYLNSKIPRYSFTITPVYYKDIESLLSRGDFDFVFTNPEDFIELKYKYSIYPIATLMPIVNSKPVDKFGGVIFTKATNQKIDSLKTIRGVKV